MTVKLFDSELNIMNVLWRKGDATARSEPNFMCHALIPKEEVQAAEEFEKNTELFGNQTGVSETAE